MNAPDKIFVEIRHPFGNEFTEMIGFENRGNSDDIEYIRKGSLWKPSKEQMKALEQAKISAVAGNYITKDGLCSLYEDLKKL